MPGLAFAFSCAAAPYFILAVCLLVVAVGWAYTILRREVAEKLPEGIPMVIDA